MLSALHDAVEAGHLDATKAVVRNFRQPHLATQEGLQTALASARNMKPQQLAQFIDYFHKEAPGQADKQHLKDHLVDAAANGRTRVLDAAAHSGVLTANDVHEMASTHGLPREAQSLIQSKFQHVTGPSSRRNNENQQPVIAQQA